MDCTIIVPVFNEEKSILDFCKRLLTFRESFNEVIFVDAGSVDGTVGLLEKFSSDLNARVIVHQGSLPGLGRNLGVKAAKSEYIAFLDVGVIPDKLWLKNLQSYQLSNKSPLVWGACLFSGEGYWQRIICALSNGQMRKAEYVIPASLFSKSAFQKSGGFPEDLRAGEDTLFRKNIFKEYGSSFSCPEAFVTYSTYPKTLFAALKKWFLYAQNCAKGNVLPKQEAFYFCFLLLQVFLMALNFRLFFLFLITYFIFRGVIDPIRRSKESKWWCHWSQVIVAPVFAYLLDIAKAFGFLKGRLFKLFD